MKISSILFRRLLFVCFTVFVIVALVLVLGVIPPVKIEALQGTTTETAVKAFWVNVGLNLLSAFILIFIAIKSKFRSWISTSVLVIIGFMVLLLGLALADAASAYQSHGPSMQSASIILFICAAVDFLGGALVITTAILRPKKT
jgi:hypothetical protein